MDFIITFDEKDLSTIVNALANQPYGVVFQLIDRIQAQVKNQAVDKVSAQ